VTAVRSRGTWPGAVALRRGWALAHARPWNRDIPDAALRLVRGSSAFLEACTDHLIDLGVRGVASPPVLDSGRGVWERAGFGPHLRLDLYRCQLPRSDSRPPHAVAAPADACWDRAAEIDRAAFEPPWRLEELGLREAYGSTTHRVFLTVGSNGRIDGFAIVGAELGAAYLQRVAVDPIEQGRGLGKSLVREAQRWAGRHGAHTILLNTQPENQRAAALYRAEGFRLLPDRLEVLRRR
jgi:ribosomal protein S18 acetylase RimI-like enzyme